MSEIKPMDSKNQPVILNPVADVVDIQSNGELVTITFMTETLDKTQLPNHRMILSSVMMHRDLALKVAASLVRHAGRGAVSPIIKTHPLPPGMKLPSDKKV